MTDHISLGSRHTYGGGLAPYFIPISDLTRHVHIIGKTGMGKSTLLKSVVLQLIHAGEGVGVIDPHGDLISEILDALPPDRAESVVLIDPADPEFGPALNVLANHPPEERPRIASALVSTFRHVWAESWGPRLEYILYHAIRALLDCDHASLLGLPLLLVDRDYRRSVTAQIEDPFIRRFWTDEFESYDHRFRMEAIAPIQNKIGQLLAIPTIRESFGQMRRKVEFQECMDMKRILLVHVPKGVLGEDAARLFGAIIVSLTGSAAFSRISVPEAERTPFTLVIDEVHNFMTDSFESILSEARKYGLGTVLSHQYLGQFSETMRSAVLGNAGTTLAFRTGAKDSEILAKHYADAFTPAQFASLPPFDALLRPPSPGSFPVQLSLSFPQFPTHNRADRIRRAARSRSATPRSRVRDRLRCWVQK